MWAFDGLSRPLATFFFLPFRSDDMCFPVARCLIPAERSRVVIAGVKRWPFDVTDAMVPHGENVTFYCKHDQKQCSFGATQTCFDGKLQPPACYLGKPVQEEKEIKSDGDQGL